MKKTGEEGDWKKKTGDRGGWRRIADEAVKKRKREIHSCEAYVSVLKTMPETAYTLARNKLCQSFGLCHSYFGHDYCVADYIDIIIH